MKEPDLPFYLGVKPERKLSWWHRRQRRKALKKYLKREALP